MKIWCATTKCILSILLISMTIVCGLLDDLNAGIIFYDPMENNNYLNITDGRPGWKYPPRIASAGLNAIKYVASGTQGITAYAGNGMFQFNKLSGRDRAEIYLQGKPPNVSQNLANLEGDGDTDYWFGWAWYIPDATYPVWPSESMGYDWIVFTQFHSPTPAYANCTLCGYDGCSGQDYEGLLRHNGDNTYSVRYRTRAQISRTECQGCSSTTTAQSDWHSVSLDAWHTTVVHLRTTNASNTANGVFEVWLDGTQIVSASGIHIGKVNFCKGQAPLIGLYAGVNEDDPQSATIYYDEFRVGDNNSSYAEVAPQGGSNAAPTVTMSPATTQNIVLGGSVTFSSTATDSDGSIASYLWDFDDSGISQSTAEDPGSKTFNSAGTFIVRVTVTDDDGATASDSITVVVDAAAITGLINHWAMESGAITTDSEGNEALVNNNSIASESSGTEPTWDSGGTWGVELNGTNQYFSVANWDANNPWQTGKPDGTYVVGIKTPSSAVTGDKYLGARYSRADSNRVIGLLLSSTGNQAAVRIGTGSGTSYETYYAGTTLANSTRYIIIYTVDADAKSWAIYTWNGETDTWESDATGSFSGDMHLAGTSSWNIGRVSDGGSSSYFNGTLYFAQVYNTVLTKEEAVQLVSGSYTPPPAESNAINSMFVCDCTSGDAITKDTLYRRGQTICIKTVFDQDGIIYSGPYSNFNLPAVLDAGGPANFKYRSGSGTNAWIWEYQVGNTDEEEANLSFATVGVMDRDWATSGTNSDIVNGAGQELTSYDLPQVAADPTYKIYIKGTPMMYFPSE